MSSWHSLQELNWLELAPPPIILNTYVGVTNPNHSVLFRNGVQARVSTALLNTGNAAMVLLALLLNRGTGATLLHLNHELSYPTDIKKVVQEAIDSDGRD